MVSTLSAVSALKEYRSLTIPRIIQFPTDSGSTGPYITGREYRKRPFR